MTTESFSTPLTGYAAIASGVSVILAVIFITLMFTLDMRFGALNDVCNSLIGISSAVLAGMLFGAHPARAPLLSQLALAIAIAGAVFTIIGSILVMTGYTGFILAGWYTGIGNALIGLWLVAFCTVMRGGDEVPRNLLIFGVVAGAFMALGLIGIPGIFARTDSMESMPLILYVAYLGYLGTYLLYPVWTIWLGRTLLLK